jgi:hypothetical protein
LERDRGETSPRTFDLQLASGEHYLGSILASAAGELVVRLEDGATARVKLAELVRLAPIGASIWNRLDGSLDAGFSFMQADLETHWTLNGTAAYRSPRYQLNADTASQISSRTGSCRSTCAS